MRKYLQSLPVEQLAAVVRDCPGLDHDLHPSQYPQAMATWLRDHGLRISDLQYRYPTLPR